MKVTAIHHVQLAMPAGGEDQARGFYAGVLGLAEVPKPATLAGRGGVWFERCALRVHLGVDEGFVAAHKAHPAFLVEGLASLTGALERAGYRPSADAALEGFERVYVNDPFGNRIELMEESKPTTA